MIWLVSWMSCGAREESAPIACTPLQEGTWSLEGSCFGMEMIGTVQSESDGCSFIFSDWSMVMEMPDGGTLDGTTLTLTGDLWETCSGPNDGTTASGTCTSNGCVYEMSWIEP